MVFGLGAYAGLMASAYEIQYIGFVWPLTIEHRGLFLFLAISVISPVVEESVKPVGLYLLKLTQARMSARDWILLGAAAGCGFGVLENAVYAIGAMPYGGSAVLIVTALRFALPFPMHLATSSIAGFGVMRWRKSGRILELIRFLAVSITIHSFYNLLTVVAEGRLP